jgi:hypothetical protein
MGSLAIAQPMVPRMISMFCGEADADAPAPPRVLLPICFLLGLKQLPPEPQRGDG